MDAIGNFKDDSPLHRYTNALQRHQKSTTHSGMHHQVHDDTIKENPIHRLSSSDESILKNDRPKSISSIDTQSVNNILDEYEDLDCDKSTNSASIIVTNYEALLDQRKRQQLARTFVTTNAIRHGLACGPSERHEKKQVLRVNRQSQVRQRSRDRQKELVSSCKLPAIDRNVSSTIEQSLTDNHMNKKPPPPEVLLMRRGEVQKRVDEWLNQSQSQNLHRESTSRRVLLARSSSSAEQKKRYCNGLRSTNEIMESHLHATASCDNLSGKKTPREEYKVGQVSDEANTTAMHSPKNSNALKNCMRHHQQGSKIGLPSSKIPQRDLVWSVLPRNREYNDKVRSEEKISIITRLNEKNYFKPESRDVSKTELANNSVVTQITSAHSQRSTIKCSNTADIATSFNKVGESRRHQIATQTHVQPCGTFNETRNEIDVKRRVGRCTNAPMRRPPAPPRRDQSNQTNRERMARGSTNDQLPCSSFKPTNVISVNQQNERNVSTESHYAVSKNVEEIFEMSLQPEVIHADDLRTVLSPAVKTSVYRDDTEDEEYSQCPRLMHTMQPNCGEVTRAYPHIDLAQYRKIKKQVLNTKDSRVGNMNGEVTIENGKTFSTFQHDKCVQAEIPNASQEQIISMKEETDESIFEHLHNISLRDSYEAKSTLRLDRNFGTNRMGNLENRSKSPQDFHGNIETTSSSHLTTIDDTCSRNHRDKCSKATPLCYIADINPEKLEHSEMSLKQKSLKDVKDVKEDHRAVVSDVLVKTLCFNQDIPEETKNNSLRNMVSVMNRKPLNFNSVLSDDYENVKSQEANRLQQCKIYITKEEIERQKFISLLKNGDYNAVKMVSATYIINIHSQGKYLLFNSKV